MNEQISGYCHYDKPSRLNLIWLHIKNRIYKVTRRIAFWLSMKLRRIGVDTPEFFQKHRFLIRWLGGLDQFCHTHWCGHGFRFSAHIGNIYWKIGTNDPHHR